jgi:phospholipid transport system substrate-binding protein
MNTVLTRRSVLTCAAATFVLAISSGIRPASAQGTQADAFLMQFADRLVGIVNGPNPAAQKKAALGPVIDSDVDVAKIARFCLGRFWATATPAQQAQYTTLFHQVLLNQISGNLGAYRGVSYRMTGDSMQGSQTLVGTMISRPNAPTANVKWVVDTSAGAPKIVDVIAEGTSLRLTQRSDYASYLSQHGDDISALLAALERQLGNAG